MMQTLFDRVAKKYDLTYHFTGGEIQNEIEINIIKDQLKGRREKKVILDAGVGTGRFMSVFDNDVIFGLDISKEMLKIAKSKMTKNTCLILGDIENLPLKMSAFDVILSIGVLQYTKNPSQAIREVYRVLKPGGLFILTVPNKFAPLRDIAKILLGIGYRLKRRSVNNRNVKHFSISEIKEMMENQFSIIKLYTIFPINPGFFNELEAFLKIKFPRRAILQILNRKSRNLFSTIVVIAMKLDNISQNE